MDGICGNGMGENGEAMGQLTLFSLRTAPTSRQPLENAGLGEFRHSGCV